jgi:hypothetical protein
LVSLRRGFRSGASFAPGITPDGIFDAVDERHGTGQQEQAAHDNGNWLVGPAEDVIPDSHREDLGVFIEIV